jgi:hypothetical protein
MLLADECARQVAPGTAPAATPANPFANWTMPGAGINPKGNGLPALPNFANAGSMAATVILIFIVALCIGLLIGAMFVMLATRMVAGFTPSFGMAIVAILLSVAASIAIATVMGLLRASSGGQLSPVISLISIVVSIIIHSCIYGAMLRDGAEPIGAGKGCLVILLQNILAVVVVIGIAVICVLAGVSLPVLNHLQQKATAPRLCRRDDDPGPGVNSARWTIGGRIGPRITRISRI